MVQPQGIDDTIPVRCARAVANFKLKIRSYAFQGNEPSALLREITDVSADTNDLGSRTAFDLGVVTAPNVVSRTSNVC